MKKIIITSLMTALIAVQATEAQRLQQPLERSVVAVNRSGSTIRSVTGAAGQGNLISWRKLAQEPEGTTYNVYRRTKGATNYTKMNAQPLKVTNYVPSTLTSNTEYAVTAITPDGVEGPMSRPFLYKTQAYPNVWFDFNFDNNVIKRDDYRTKYCWPMDLDGNGEFDAVVVDRLFAGATGSDDAENQSDNISTTTHKIQAYKFDGTLLWTVDMGPNVNICAGQNDMVLAYDINCDGKCEVIIRSSDGTRFWNKQGETWGKYVGGKDTPDTDGDGITDYRMQTTYNPPFYISVIDGQTGAELCYNELKYEDLTEPGGDAYRRNNRSSYMSFGYGAMEGHYGIAYLDGIHPSLIMECEDRDTGKQHHGYVLTWGFDWAAGTPANWQHTHTWVRNPIRPYCSEFHQIRILDGDGDGCDEMWAGGYGVNPAQNYYVSTGIGHGDRFVISDIDPDRPGLEGYAIQQSALLGQLLYDTRTAERIKEWYLPSVYDVGRGACLDIDDSHKGYEILSYVDEYVYDCKGEKTGQTRSGTMFEGIWWDGRLQREWLNSPGGSGVGTNLMVTRVLGDRLCEFSQESNWATHANTGTRPAFMGDLTGDWREEVILAKQGTDSSTGLVGYTTNIPTNYSIYCLQQDPHYRLDCTTRGYYQHPNTGFYLGGDMPLPPLPPVFETDLRWGNNGFTNFDMTQTAELAEGKSVMFDIAGNNSSTITTDAAFNAPCVYIMNPRGHDYAFLGHHKQLTTGSGTLIKSMQGKATLICDLGHTGPTIISEGTLEVERNSIAGPVELRARGTLSGSVTLQDTITFEGALNYEGCRLMPGFPGILSKKSMVLPGNVYLEISTQKLLTTNGEPNGYVCGTLYVEGDLTFKNTNYITVNLASNNAERYTIAQCSGTLTCDLTKLKTRGLEGINYDFEIEDNKRLVLVINATRAPAENVVWTGNESNLWDYKAQNFSLNGATAFVAGDAPVFNEEGTQKTITLNEMMVTSGVTFDSGKYVLSGEGGISGEGGVTINSDANVTLNMKYSDYTGVTTVNKGGTLTIPNFYDGGQKSAIGAATAKAGNLVLNGGTLVLSKDNMGTDRIITLTDTATIRIALSNSALSLKGQVRGTGYLIKDGAGQLNFTYGGANPFAGVIVKKGIIAQGAWNATFGKSGSPMVLSGGEVHQIDVNSTSTIPEYNYVTTVVEGTTNKIVGSSRGRINGSFSGAGNLTIRTRYVRCDVGANFSQFEGKLTASGAGGNFRLMTNVTDMSKAQLVIDAGTYMAHFGSGSGSEATATTKIGSLSSASTATDATLGGSGSTYHIGYRGDDTSFYGLLKAAKIVKVGDGRLTLLTPGHTSPITVSGGTLELYNTTNSIMTTNAITVEGGMLSGTGMAQTVVVKRGGTIRGGLSIYNTGVLRINGNLTYQTGATTLVNLSSGGNTRITVNGKITHVGDTLLIRVPAGRQLSVGDEIQVYTTGFSGATGDVNIKCESEDATYDFDTSALNTEGKVIVSGVISGIRQILSPGTPVDVFSTGGVQLRSGVSYGQALSRLPSGIYVISVRTSDGHIRSFKVTK